MKLADKILKLRAKGKNYNEIKKILGCSKGTIAYHCGDGQKEKASDRRKKHRKSIRGIISKKIYVFLSNKIKNYKREAKSVKRGKAKTNSRFSYNSAYDKILNNPICYLTGRKIDLFNSRSYHFDHIISIKNKGKNTLKNLGLTCRDANQAKGDLSVQEFIQLCIEVCKYNGYNVIKK